MRLFDGFWAWFLAACQSINTIRWNFQNSLLKKDLPVKIATKTPNEL